MFWGHLSTDTESEGIAFLNEVENAFHSPNRDDVRSFISSVLGTAKCTFALLNRVVDSSTSVRRIAIVTAFSLPSSFSPRRSQRGAPSLSVPLLWHWWSGGHQGCMKEKNLLICRQQTFSSTSYPKQGRLSSSTPSTTCCTPFIRPTSFKFVAFFARLFLPYIADSRTSINNKSCLWMHPMPSMSCNLFTSPSVRIVVCLFAEKQPLNSLTVFLLLVKIIFLPSTPISNNFSTMMYV